MTDPTFRIHWLAFTVHAPKETALDIYNDHLKEHFSDMKSTERGGNGFREIYSNPQGVKIYTGPAFFSGEFYQYVIPGQACDLLPTLSFASIYQYLTSEYSKFNISRIDIALDHLKFEPMDVAKAITESKVRSLTTRESLNIIRSPFEIRDNGDLGTCTVYFGSRLSERRITVYNKRGHTRLEFILKGNRANLVALDLFGAPDISDWGNTIISHLRDYIDFNTDWWEELINNVPRAGKTIFLPKGTSLEDRRRWIYDQVAPSLSLIHDELSGKEIKRIIDNGRSRRGPKYDSLLE